MNTLAQLSSVDYASLFKSLPLALAVVDVDDPDFTILEENEAHISSLGLRKKTAAGHPLFDAYAKTLLSEKEKSWSQLLGSMRQAIQTKQSSSLADFSYYIEDDKSRKIQKRWQVMHQPLFSDAGEVVAVYQVCQDISENYLASQKFNQTKHQLAQTLASGSIATWVWDIKEARVTGDGNLANLFGLSEQQLSRGIKLEKFTAAIHPDDYKRVTQEIIGAVKNQESLKTEYRTINRDGDVRSVTVHGQIELNDQGEPSHVSGVAIDITDQRRVQNNLEFLVRASNLFAASLDYKETLANIAGMVVPHIADWCTVDLVDENGLLQQVAVAHKDPEKVAWAKDLRLKQGPPDPSAPTGAPNVLRTGEAEIYPHITDEMLAAGARDKQELKLMRSLNFTSVILAPLKINTRIMGVITLTATESRIHYQPSDLELAKGLANRAALAVYNAELFQSAQKEIKERKRLQKQLEVANAALESRVFKRTKQLEATNKDLEDEITRRQKVENILQESSNNLARSNQELQDFAYVASHDLQEPLRKIQAFGDILENEFAESLGAGSEYLARMRSAASRMSLLIEDLLAFSRVSTRERPKVAVNLNSIVREVTNDLESRIDQTQGQIDARPLPTVWADPTHMRQLFQNLIGNALKFHRPGVPPVVKIHVAASADSKKMHTIFVEDNGIGFDEKYLDRIFSVFQRLHGRDSYGGTGIGLAVCRKIAERYGGTITATSQKDKGSKFIFSLPVKRKDLTK